MKIRQKEEGKRQKIRIAVLSVLTFSFCFFIFGVCYAETKTMSSSILIERAKVFDGKTISYQGEAITAVMPRGEYSWVNVHDGDNAIGVWAKTGSLSGVKVLGDYKHRGDVVMVDGIFNRACPLHGGDCDIHAEIISVVKPGSVVRERIDQQKTFLTLAIFLITLYITSKFRKRT